MMDRLAFALGRLKGNPTTNVQNKWMTKPNMWTGIGIMGVIVYSIMILTRSAGWFSPIINACIIYTDYKDGKLADELAQHTIQGKIMDPLRDRLHLAAMLLHMSMLVADKNPWTPIYMVICAEVLVIVSSAVACLASGIVVGGVHTVGKGRSVVHWSAMLIFLIQYSWLNYELVNYVTLIYVMAVASMLAASFYALRALATIACLVPRCAMSKLVALIR